MKPATRMSATVAALLTAVLTVVLIGAVSVVFAAPASAHTSLKSASPTDGATVGPPDQVVLTYTDPVRFTQVLVTDSAGRQYQSGRPVNVDNTVTENVSQTMPNGRYTVAWRVVAPDGHPVEGTYEFTVTGSAATAPAAAPAAPSQSTGSSTGTGLWWILLIVLLIAAAGIGGVMLLRQPAADSDAEGEADEADEADEAAAEPAVDTKAQAGSEADPPTGRRH